MRFLSLGCVSPAVRDRLDGGARDRIRAQDRPHRRAGRDPSFRSRTLWSPHRRLSVRCPPAASLTHLRAKLNPLASAPPRAPYRLTTYDGLLVLRRLRDLAATTLTPVIVVSGREPIAARESVLEAGAAGYLAKPFETSALLAEVNRVRG
jgi:Response regulator receiver domain